jgi:hypothetical protein
MEILDRFLSKEGRATSPQEWLRSWAAEYKGYDEQEYDCLIRKHSAFSASHFERIGQWKDNATNAARWRPNVASVAYLVWKQAACELPCTKFNDVDVQAFLADWSFRRYIDEFAPKPGSQGARRVEKSFGLSRATTLLHFMSGGFFPIFDARVRRATRRLLGAAIPNKVDAYIGLYWPLFWKVAALSEANNLRTLDRALFSYGAGKLSFEE